MSAIPAQRVLPRPALIGALTGIRAVAAFWVFLRHFRTEIIDGLGPGPVTQAIIHIASAGYLGVDLFFVLSGFILTYTHLQPMTDHWDWRKAVGFLWLRLARVWPLTAFVLMLFGAYFVVQSVVSGDPRYYAQADPGRLLLHLTLLVGWFPAPLDWNGVDWSVSAEWLAYLTFAVGVVALGRFAAVASRKTMIVAALMLMLPILIVGFSLQDDSILLFSDNSFVTAAGVLPIRVLCEFWAGAIVALLAQRYLGAAAEEPRGLWRLPVPTITAVAIVAAILLVSVFDPVRNLRAGDAEFYRGIDIVAPTESIIVLPLLVLLIASLAICRRDPLSALLGTRLFLLGGRASFAFYLVHPLVIGAGVFAIAELGGGGSAVVIALGVLTAVAAWVAAWLLWRLVEEPSRRVLRRMLPGGVRV
jgi:peptidoglycan/LPS O-acetylase OafA/YrhL